MKFKIKITVLVFISLFVISSCSTTKDFTKTQKKVDELKNNKELDCQKDNIQSVDDLYKEAMELQKEGKGDEADIKIMAANELIKIIEAKKCPKEVKKDKKDKEATKVDENTNLEVKDDFSAEIKEVKDPANENISLSVVANYKPETVYFDFNSYNIKEDSVKILLQHLNFLIANPQVNVIIGGHTDSRGSEEYNLTLGEKRALRVKKFFTDQGIDKERTKTISYGEELLADELNTELAHNKNRRAEFKFLISK